MKTYLNSCAPVLGSGVWVVLFTLVPVDAEVVAALVKFVDVWNDIGPGGGDDECHQCFQECRCGDRRSEELRRVSGDDKGVIGGLSQLRVHVR